MQNIIRKILPIFLSIYFGLGLVLFTFQSIYIYSPDKTDFQNCPTFKNAEKISFNSSRGYLTRRSSEKIIIFYHGNAGRACDRDYMDSYFAVQNYSTYFVEYPGYAEKEVNPSMEKILKSVDDTISFLETQKFKKIIIVGESIGVGPASYHASSSKIDNLILITAYNNLASVAFSHYPIYPMKLLLLNNFTPDIWLKKYNGPINMILADEDKIIPNKLGKKLFETIPSNKKNLYTIKDAGHNTIYEKDEFYFTLKTILR